MSLSESAHVCGGAWDRGRPHSLSRRAVQLGGKEGQGFLAVTTKLDVKLFYQRTSPAVTRGSSRMGVHMSKTLKWESL